MECEILWSRGFPAKNIMKLVVTVTGWGVNPRYIFFYVFQFIPGHVAKNVQHLHLDPHCWNKSSWYIRRFFSPEGESEFPRKDGSTKILKALQNPGRWYSLAEKKDDFQQVGFHGWNLTEALSAPQSRSLSRKRVLNKQRNGRRKALKKKRWKLKWKKRKRRLKRKRRCAIEIGQAIDVVWCENLLHATCHNWINCNAKNSYRFVSPNLSAFLRQSHFFYHIDWNLTWKKSLAAWVYIGYWSTHVDAR